MTVNTVSITNGPYIGNNVANSFSYSFRVQSKTDLKVYETSSTGVQTELTVDTDYTVNNVGNDSGGTITRLAGALPTGAQWYIRSNYPITQDTEFSSQGAFFPELHESAMDKLTYLILQQQDLINRSLKFSESSPVGASSTVLPNPESLKLLRWKADLSGLENASVSELSPGLIGETDIVYKTETVLGLQSFTNLVNNQQFSVSDSIDGGMFIALSGSLTADNRIIYSSATTGIYLLRLTYNSPVNRDLLDYWKKPKDLSGLIQTHGKKVVITGDSLSYNNYGFGFGYAATAQECYPGLRSWGFNLRDAIHMSDPCFVYGDNIPWHINSPAQAAVAVNNTAPFVLPFNNRSLRVVVTNSAAEVTLTANSWNIVDKRLVLHLAHSSGQSGKFDVYYNDNSGGADVFVQNVEVGNATDFEEFDPFTVIIPVNTVDSCARIIFKNFTDVNDDPITTSVAFYVLALGSKLTNVYTTGVGGSTSEFTNTFYDSLIGDYDPDLLVLCTGANDRFNYGIDRHLVALDSIITKARTTNPAMRIIHITTPPAQGGGNEGYFPDTEIRHGTSMRQWVSAVERLCAYRDVEFFNQYRFFYDIDPSYLFVDGIHLSRNAGRDLFRALIAKHFSSCGAPVDQLTGYSTYSVFSADLMGRQIGRLEDTRATVKLSGQFKMTYNHATTNWILSDNYEYGTNKPSAFKGFNIPGAAHTTNIEFFVPCVSTAYNEAAFPLSATAEYVGGVISLPVTGLTLRPNTDNTLQFIIRDIDGALIDPATMDGAQFIIKYRM